MRPLRGTAASSDATWNQSNSAGGTQHAVRPETTVLGRRRKTAHRADATGAFGRREKMRMRRRRRASSDVLKRSRAASREPSVFGRRGNEMQSLRRTAASSDAIGNQSNCGGGKPGPRTRPEAIAPVLEETGAPVRS